MDYNSDDDNYVLTDLNRGEAVKEIRNLYLYGTSPQADGFTQCTCKQKMYLLKCLIEDLYNQMPDFPHQEKEWEQERLIQLLKRTDQ